MQVTLYLTFDDGPSRAYTPRLLDLLKQYDIKASFFVVGRFVEEHPDLVKRIVREGHYIGLHSLMHRSGYLLTPRQARADIDASINILKGLGVKPKGYRPPWGHHTPWLRRAAEKNGLEMILWDVMAEDWKKDTSAEEIAGKLLQRAADGRIICLHDGRGSQGAPGRMIEALEMVLPQWIERGYRFKRVDERDA